MILFYFNESRLSRNRRDISPRVHPLETDLSWLVFASAIPPRTHLIGPTWPQGFPIVSSYVTIVHVREIWFCVSDPGDVTCRYHEIIWIFWRGNQVAPRFDCQMVGQEDVASGLGVVHGSTRRSEQYSPTSALIELVGYYVVQFRTLARGALSRTQRCDAFVMKMRKNVDRSFPFLDELLIRFFITAWPI